MNTILEILDKYALIQNRYFVTLNYNGMIVNYCNISFLDAFCLFIFTKIHCAAIKLINRDYTSTE